ncbi:MAG: hypothetical protein RIC56_14920 [Pseudomonadales bacterium]
MSRRSGAAAAGGVGRSIQLRRLLGACGLCLVLPVGAGELVRATLRGDFHETVQEEVSVSGSVVVGVAAASALSGPATLSGLIIPAAAQEICLTVVSRDGVYFARNTYTMPESALAAGSFAVLPFDETRRRELIGSFKDGELAMRATPGSCDAPGIIYLVPAAGTTFETVDVLINGFGATDVYFSTAAGGEGECEEYREGRRTSYDYHCDIPVAELGAGRTTVLVERERYGRPLGEVTIELDVGASP